MTTPSTELRGLWELTALSGCAALNVCLANMIAIDIVEQSQRSTECKYFGKWKLGSNMQPLCRWSRFVGPTNDVFPLIHSQRRTLEPHFSFNITVSEGWISYQNLYLIPEYQVYIWVSMRP